MGLKRGGIMDREKYRFLPEVNGRSDPPAPEVRGDSPCPCCGSITIPNGGDALAYICPVCMWEIDLFITGPDEPSDQNHGLTLNQAKEKYRAFGAVLPRLIPYARPPRPEELPKED